MYDTYVNYGVKDLWVIIRRMHPHISGKDAKRIAEEALAIPVCATERNMRNERSWVIAKHIWAEAKKLRGST